LNNDEKRRKQEKTVSLCPSKSKIIDFKNIKIQEERTKKVFAIS